MTSFLAQAKADIQGIISAGEVSQSVSYTQGETASSINAIIGPESVDPVYDDGEYEIRRRQITVALDAEIGVANPEKDDTVTIDGQTWTVDSTPEKGVSGRARLSIVIRSTKSRHHAEHIKRIE